MTPKTRYIIGYVSGYVLCLPLTLVVLLPKIIVQHIKSAHQHANAAYNLNHIGPTRAAIVAEMEDGSLRYVEDPFPIVI